jgi:lipid A 3-O-deacylase PagL
MASVRAAQREPTGEPYRCRGRSRHTAIASALAVCYALASPRVSFAQTTQPGPWFTRVGFAPAYVVATNPFSLSGVSADRQVRSTPSFNFEIGRQTDGSRDWHHLYGMPSYGFGMSVATLGSGGVSRPMDAYTFFSWPFVRPSERVQLTTDFGMGLSWNWKAFNPRTNSYTTVLGSDLNARIDWGVYVRYALTRQTSMYAGFDFTHRSNGGMRQPDQGINVIGPSVSLRHNMGGPEPSPVALKDLPAFRPNWEFVVGGAGGPKNVFDEMHGNTRNDYGTLSVTAAFQRHFYRYGKIALGTDVMYDGSTGAQYDVVNGAIVSRRAAFGKRVATGFYGGYEHVIGRFGAIVQVGYKVASGFDDGSTPRRYERYGWRYHFNDHLWGTLAVRAVADRKADALEFGLGYRALWR